VLAAIGLVGCGGGGSDTGAPMTPTTAAVSGTLSGLSGSVQLLLYNSATQAKLATITVSANGAYNFPPVAIGTAYLVAAAGTPGQVCSVVNPTGTVSLNPTNVVINCSPGYLYVANNGSGTVSIFQTGPGTGSLSAAASSPVTVAASPDAVVLAGGFLYVTHELSSSAEAFSINAANGGLTRLAASPQNLGMVPEAVFGTATSAVSLLLALDRTGNKIDVFSVNSATGALSAVAGSPWATGQAPVALATDGKFVYVANSGSNDISAYTIAPATGALTPVAALPFPAGVTGPISVAIAYSATGTAAQLFVAGGNGYSGFTITSGTGALTALAGSPYLTAVTGPIALGYTASNTLLYAATASGIEAFAVSATGTFSPLAGSPYSTSATPHSLAFDFTGSYLYATDDTAGNLAGFVVGPSGTLTAIAGSPFAAGMLPDSIAAFAPF
jgi:6-phosphogluconolactonase (cycloisomerase 2 family)